MSDKIRKAEFTDLPQILKIYEDAREFMRQTGNPNQWWDYHPAESILREDIPKGQLYVWEEDGKLLASFAYIPGIDPTYLQIDGPGWLNEEPYGVIHRIAVAQRGQGLIARIFDWALERCPNLRIDTHVDNQPMRRALEKYGFQYCGIIHIFNGDERIAFHKANPSKNTDQPHYLSIFMCLGLSIGLAIGAGIGNIPIGMCFGMSIGVGIGALLDKKRKDQSGQPHKQDNAK